MCYLFIKMRKPNLRKGIYCFLYQKFQFTSFNEKETIQVRDC